MSKLLLLKHVSAAPRSNRLRYAKDLTSSTPTRPLDLLSVVLKRSYIESALTAISPIKTFRVLPYSLFGGTYYRPQGFIRLQTCRSGPGFEMGMIPFLTKSISLRTTYPSFIPLVRRIVKIDSRYHLSISIPPLSDAGRMRNLIAQSIGLQPFNSTLSPIRTTRKRVEKHRRILRAPSYFPFSPNMKIHLQSQSLMPSEDQDVLHNDETSKVTLPTLPSQQIHLEQCTPDSIKQENIQTPIRISQSHKIQTPRISGFNAPDESLIAPPVLSKVGQKALHYLDQLSNETFFVESQETIQLALISKRPDIYLQSQEENK